MKRDWRHRAMCSAVNPEVFEDTAHEETALAICQRCPVHAECLEYALSLTPAPDGVWGRTTAEDRQRIKRGGHRVSCPGCRGYDIYSDGLNQICLSCGISWQI